MSFQLLMFCYVDHVEYISQCFLPHRSKLNLVIIPFMIPELCPLLTLSGKRKGQGIHVLLIHSSIFFSKHKFLVLYSGMICFSYSTDFSYFPLKIVSESCWTLSELLKNDHFKEDVDGFSYFSLISVS